MKHFYHLILLLFVSFSQAQNFQFLNQQKKQPRVKKAYHEKIDTIKSNLKNHQIQLNDVNILIVAYKDSQQFDLYAKSKYKSEYKKIKTYTICEKSGELGPKRRQGDYQVPEGFYHINRYNPYSTYYLSLGINYPNTADRKKSKAANLGGDIFIHGDCATIGCLPMTDEIIKEIYLYSIHGKANGQIKVPVYIFPFKMTDTNFNSHIEEYNDQPDLIRFWRNLKIGHDLFMKNKKQVIFNIDEKGNYVF